eukprot:Hpha_TRINITY_DN19381_c0_g1::TRINITY_DN19381_c0_g1_i1::g.81270::m.81270
MGGEVGGAGGLGEEVGARDGGSVGCATPGGLGEEEGGSVGCAAPGGTGEPEGGTVGGGGAVADTATTSTEAQQQIRMPRASPLLLLFYHQRFCCTIKYRN